mmetsp:Transcript_34991/g.62537  ORF Transcript_34991/g.62537 Transcript_34991/m.62537 type:complete len:304 (-) Transcript_34991:88-999(-)
MVAALRMNLAVSARPSTSTFSSLRRLRSASASILSPLMALPVTFFSFACGAGFGGGMKPPPHRLAGLGFGAGAGATFSDAALKPSERVHLFMMRPSGYSSEICPSAVWATRTPSQLRCTLRPSGRCIMHSSFGKTPTMASASIPCSGRTSTLLASTCRFVPLGSWVRTMPSARQHTRPPFWADQFTSPGLSSQKATCSPAPLAPDWTMISPYPASESAVGPRSWTEVSPSSSTTTKSPMRLRMVPSGCRSITLPLASLPTMDPSGLCPAALTALDRAILAWAFVTSARAIRLRPDLTSASASV